MEKFIHKAEIGNEVQGRTRRRKRRMKKKEVKKRKKQKKMEIKRKKKKKKKRKILWREIIDKGEIDQGGERGGN